MFQYPYGDTQQLNLDWLMEQWQETKASIDGSLQGEIDRVEAAITDLLTARDQAVAAQTAAEIAATSASGYAGTASTAASTATAQAAAAAASAALAGNHASNAQTSETNAGLQATAAGNSASAAAVSEGNARNSELAAAASSSAAAGNALYAEGMAKGTQNGTPVTAGSPYYEDNAKYYADQAAQDASDAADSAQDAHDVLDSIPADYTQLSNDVTGLQTALAVITGNEEIVFTTGGYIATNGATADITNPTASTSYKYAVVPCKEDDYFEVNTSGASSARAWAFIDSNNTVLSRAGSNVISDSTLRAPKNSAYLVLNSKVADIVHPSYINQYAKNNAINALQRADVLASAESYNLSVIKFYVSSAQLSNGTLNFNKRTTNRITAYPGLFIYAPKGSKFYINDSASTAQLYVIKKTFDGTLSATSWATSYIVNEDAYFIPVMRYSDDSTITDVDALAEKLTIEILPYSKKAIQRNWKNDWFFDISHRGYMEEAPESTVASFCRAKAVGYNAIEIDLRITSDGAFVVHHDAGMPSNSSYLIAQHTLVELRSNANMGTYNGITQQILTFEDLIKLAKNLDFKVFVELKAEFTTAQIASIISIAKNYDMKNRVYWMASYDSTNFDYAGNFRTADSDCNILIYDTTTASNIQPFVVTGKNITFCYSRATYITATVVRNMANIGVDTIGWAVTFSWLFPNYTEQQIKQKIYDTLDCGVRGMCLDKWTTAELITMKYIDYFD